MRLRPFISNAEDYLLIQELLDSGTPVSTQHEVTGRFNFGGLQRFAKPL